MKQKKGKSNTTDVQTLPVEQDPDGETQSRGDFVRNHMRAARFIESQDASNYSEWRKSYSDPNGSIALVTALFRKDATQRDPETLEGYTITVSLHVKATQEDIDKRAWSFCRQELQTLTNIFGGPETKQRHVVTIECPKCKQVTADFLEVRGQNVCFACYEKTLSI